MAIASFESTLTTYDIFAATITAMVLGHLVQTFIPGPDSWLRVPDRILLPVFLVSVGYNVGRKVDRMLLAGAALLLLQRWFLFHVFFFPPVSFVPMTTLITIIVARLVIEPLMRFALRSKAHFWATNILLVLLIVPSLEYFSEYGTSGILMVMAGWLNRNRDELPAGIVSVKEYFLFIFCVYMAMTQRVFVFTPLQLATIAAGAAYVFRLLYLFRPLLLNTLRRRPRDPIEKICSFIGHHSIEIYVAHILLFHAIYYYAVA